MRMRELVFGVSIAVFGVAIASADPAPPPAAPAPAAVAAATNSGGGTIQFAATVGEFGKVQKGQMVKYTYTFTNIGADTLEIKNVQPGCGCTTAGDWSRKVEPGKSGTIPIQFNSQNFNGPVTKFVTVTTSDPKSASIQLQLKGTIWNPIEVSSQFVTLAVTPDNQHPTGQVTINNNLEAPLHVWGIESNNKIFTAEVKTNTLGKNYQVMVSVVPPIAPNPSGQITLKTSATNMPEIKITAWVSEQPLISVYPMQLAVQPAPLTSPQTLTLTIVQNSTNNNLKVTDAAVVEANTPVKNVEVSLKETQPGHYYNAFVTFPTNFELAQGHALEFTAKTTSEKLPVIHVPITQAPRPPVPPPAPGGVANLTPGAPAPTPLPGGAAQVQPVSADGHKLPTPAPRATQ